MDLDCEMNELFAKRLQKQQMRSPVSTLISRKHNTSVSCKRRLEIDVDQNLESEKEVQSICETVENDVDNKLVENSITTKNILLDSVNNNCTITMIEKDSFILTKDMFFDTGTKILGRETLYQNCEVNPLLRLHNNAVQEICSAADRYIPSRISSNWRDFTDNSTGTQVLKKLKCSEDINENVPYTSILRNELLGDNIEGVNRTCNDLQDIATIEHKNIFKFSSNMENDQNDESHSYSLSPVGAKSQQLLRSPCKTNRRISKIPFKVLDAPDLQNDFYLNLVDWSSQNMLGVGLGSSVYLWSANTSQVVRLCDLTSEGNSVTSVSWNDKGNYLAIGTFSGAVQIWDVAVSKKIAHLVGHTARVGSSAWNGSTLATGSRDKLIFMRDIRSSHPEESPCCIYESHRQEICGLKWSPDGQYLASGGNDNQLFVWSKYSFRPVQSYSAHTAAVKAISWSPHQHGLLASGGGTADRCIRFWNTLTGQPVQNIDTGSQVCNLAWSKNSCELVSTHGYSQNQIVVWKYPSLTQIVKLTGHSYRVLYLAMSPDGESIVTGAGDETLRFWNIFSKTSSQRENRSVLNLFSTIR